MPIVSVTPLGSGARDVDSAIGQIIDYLHRGGARRPELNPSIVGYYADTPTEPGVWRGRGVAGEQLIGQVTVDQLRLALQGRHPLTGAGLVDAVGSAGRRANRDGAARVLPPVLDRLDVHHAARLLGVSPGYVQRLALETERNPAASNPLSGDRDAVGRWWFRREEVERFAAARKEPKVVVAFDVTVSFEKSISLAWARGNADERRVIEAAFDAGTDAAVAYLEDHALAVRRGLGAVKADGVWAASYRHVTNRNLEPQLHDHVVIANIASADGRTQTIDSRLLHHHAKTAGYVAGAVTRRQLTETLGVGWQRVERGLADIEGVSRQMIDAFSTRRAEISRLVDELGVETAAARNVAALATRAPKTGPADWAVLEDRWRAQLDAVGLDPDRWHQLRATTTIVDLDARAEGDVLAWLDSAVGVTRQNAVFSRREVVQAIVEWDGTFGGGTRLDLDTIDRLTDTYLATPNVVGLDMTGAQVTRTGETRWYSTVAMVELERAVIDAYMNARINHSVDRRMVDAARLSWENTTGLRLGDDQVAMVDAVTTSPAGSSRSSARLARARPPPWPSPPPPGPTPAICPSVRPSLRRRPRSSLTRPGSRPGLWRR